jgi:hypothetical protein
MYYSKSKRQPCVYVSYTILVELIRRVIYPPKDRLIHGTTRTFNNADIIALRGSRTQGGKKLSCDLLPVPYVQIFSPAPLLMPTVGDMLIHVGTTKASLETKGF